MTVLRLLIISFCFFLFNILNAQPDIEYIFSKEKRVQMRAIAHTDGITFVGGSFNDCSRDIIYALNDAGEILWDATTYGHSTVTDMYFRESDQTLIVAVDWRGADDYTTPADGARVYGFDIQGNTLFGNNFLSSAYGFMGYPRLTSSPDGGIVMAGRKWIFKMNSMGILENSIFIDSAGYADIVSINDSTFLGTSNVYLPGGILETDIQIVNNQGLISNVDVNEQVSDITLDENRALILSETDILIYDLVNETLTSANTPTNIISERNMTADENYVYVFGKIDQSEIPIIERYNKADLAFVDFISVEKPCQVNEISSNESELFILGVLPATESIEEDSNWTLRQSFVKTIPAFEPLEFKGSDIAITNLNITQPAVVDSINPVTGVYYFSNPYINFEYDVTNTGNDTIYSFTTISQHYTFGICLEPRLFSHTSNVIIPPGATYTKMDVIPSWYARYQDELKLIAIAPNHHFDGNPNDNVVSENIISYNNNTFTDVEYVVSEHEHSLLEQVIHVDGTTITGGSFDFCRGAALLAFDESGEKIWDIVLSEGTYSWVTDLYYKSSDEMLIVTVRYSQGDDFGTLEDGPTVFGIDLNGNVQFEKRIEMTDWNLSLGYGVASEVWKYPSFTTVNGNNEIVTTRAEHLFWLDNGGVLLDSVRYADEFFAGIGRINAVALATISHDKIIIMDNDGNFENTIETGSPLINMVVDGDRIIAMSDSAFFYVYDYVLDTLLVSSYPSNNLIDNRLITVDNNWIYVSGNTDDSEIPIIQKYSKTNIGWASDEISVGQPGKIVDIFSNNDEFFIAGQQVMMSEFDTIPFFQLRQSFVKSTPVFTAPLFKGTDISLSNIFITRPAEVDYYDSLEYRNVYTNPYAVFEYDVTNEGTDIIYSYAIASNWYSGLNCEQFRFYSYVDNVMILPGETITKIDSLESIFSEYDSELKLTVFAPSHHFDGDTNNNSLVADDPLLPIVECDCSYGVQFSVFPNPASEQLNVFLQSENTTIDGKIRLVNLNGQVLRENIVMSQQSNYSFSVKALPKGIYFLQYQKEGRSVKIEKVVIH